MQVVTFSELRGQLKEIMDASADSHEIVIIKRQRAANMVLLSQSDYESLQETAYLLSSEANVAHIRKSLRSLKEKKLTRKSLSDK